jgi:hypothetical protein
VRIIAPVREPLSRNISAFFENIRAFGFPEDPADIPIQRLLDTFVSKYGHHIPATWFDAQVLEVFGIDVFAEPLDFSSGGHVIHGGSADLLLLRMEDANEIREEAIRRFAGLASFQLATLNSGEDKPYRGAYRRFVKQFRPQAEFVDQLYGSRFARHFYSSDELIRFRDRWVA